MLAAGILGGSTMRQEDRVDTLLSRAPKRPEAPPCLGASYRRARRFCEGAKVRFSHKSRRESGQTGDSLSGAAGSVRAAPAVDRLAQHTENHDKVRSLDPCCRIGMRRTSRAAPNSDACNLREYSLHDVNRVLGRKPPAKALKFGALACDFLSRKSINRALRFADGRRLCLERACYAKPCRNMAARAKEVSELSS